MESTNGSTLTQMGRAMVSQMINQAILNPIQMKNFDSILIQFNPTTLEIKKIPYSEIMLEKNRIKDRYQKFNINYLDNVQKDLKSPDRNNSVEWIIHIGFRLRLNDFSICMAIKLFDNLLSTKPLNRNDLELECATLLLIEAKANEPNNLSIVSKIINLTTNITDEMLLENEIMIFQHTNYNVFVITPLDFIQYYFSIIIDLPLSDSSQNLFENTRFFLFCSLSLEFCCKYTCEEIALACILVASVITPETKVRISNLTFNINCAGDVYTSVNTVINDTTSILFSYFSERIQMIQNYFKISREEFMNICQKHLGG